MIRKLLLLVLIILGLYLGVTIALESLAGAVGTSAPAQIVPLSTLTTTPAEDLAGRLYRPETPLEVERVVQFGRLVGVELSDQRGASVTVLSAAGGPLPRPGQRVTITVAAVQMMRVDPLGIEGPVLFLLAPHTGWTVTG